MYFNSSSRDGRRKSRRQGTRDESRVAECGLLSQILMIDRLKLDFFYLVMRPQLLTQRPNPKRDNMIWSNLIQRKLIGFSNDDLLWKSILMRVWSENPPHPKIERLKHPWNSICNWWFCRIVFLCSFMFLCSYDLMSWTRDRFWIARILTFFPIFVYLFRCEPVFFRLHGFLVWCLCGFISSWFFWFLGKS